MRIFSFLTLVNFHNFTLSIKIHCGIKYSNSTLFFKNIQKDYEAWPKYMPSSLKCTDIPSYGSKSSSKRCINPTYNYLQTLFHLIPWLYSYNLLCLKIMYNLGKCKLEDWNAHPYQVLTCSWKSWKFEWEYL